MPDADFRRRRYDCSHQPRWRCARHARPLLRPGGMARGCGQGSVSSLNQSISALLAMSACLAGALAEAQAPPAPPPQLARLSSLIGAWNVDDTYQPPGAPPIRDVGVRTCAYVLMQRYIECTTRARNPETGREREYRWLINYNTESRRYDIVGVFSNYAGKVTQTFHVDSASGRGTSAVRRT